MAKSCKMKLDGLDGQTFCRRKAEHVDMAGAIHHDRKCGNVSVPGELECIF